MRYSTIKVLQSPTPSHKTQAADIHKLFSPELAHPRYWLLWLGLALLRLLAYLPEQFRSKVATYLGFIAYKTAKRRRHITQVNIKLAFPELSAAEQDQLVRSVFKQNILGLFDIGLVAWGNHKKLHQLTTIHGAENLSKAYSQGKGVMLVGAHYSCLELGGLLFSFFYPVTALYRPHKNALFDRFLKVSRNRFCDGLLVKSDMRGMVRALKKGKIFWYPADQDYGRKHAVFAPFFNIPAATINITSRLAKINRSPVLVFSCHRISNGRFAIHISKPLNNIPSGNDTDDAARVNAEIEAGIRKFPAQYMWVHRRFKTRPEGEPSYY